MGWFEAAAWGTFGGFAMEALDFITAVRRHRRVPWRKLIPEDPGPAIHAVTSVLRLTVGAGVAAAASRTSPSVSAWLALGLGAAAPVILEKLTALIPLVARSAAEQALKPSGAIPHPLTFPTEPTSVNGHPTAPDTEPSAVGDRSRADFASGSPIGAVAMDEPLHTEPGQGRA
jgi:hypothetical protein